MSYDLKSRLLNLGGIVSIVSLLRCSVPLRDHLHIHGSHPDTVLKSRLYPKQLLRMIVMQYSLNFHFFLFKISFSALFDIKYYICFGYNVILVSMYNMVIRDFCTFRSDHPDRTSIHLAPYVVISVLKA